MNQRAFKKAARRITVVLFVVALLSILDNFPDTGTAAQDWTYIFSHMLILHAILGTLVVGDAAALLVRAVRGYNRAQLLFAGLGLAFIVIAWTSGVIYTSTHQYLEVMEYVWVAAITTYGVAWFKNRASKVPKA